MKEKHICEYGCGQGAKHQMNNGKWCCSENYNSCPELRRKNSVAHKGKKNFFKNGHPNPMKGVIPWNKGLTKETDERVANNARKLKEKINELKANGKYKGFGIASTEEKELQRKRKISETMKRNGISRGIRHGSGRGKKGWYKGYFCDSSWELAYVI